jgi:hypothetical protein
LGGAAFSGCEKLIQINLRKVTEISNGTYTGLVFAGCKSLRILLFPATPPKMIPDVANGGNFQNTYDSSNTNEQIIIHVGYTPGAVAAYTTAWTADTGSTVTAATNANGNTTAFGTSHKRILITE